MYTEIGWENFQSWLHKGGFDNYLYTPNPIHRRITREATIRLMHHFSHSLLGKNLL